ncbi:hypothetical protein EON66_11970, partial [archaeon]
MQATVTSAWLRAHAGATLGKWLVVQTHGMKPTRIFSVNQEVDRVNQEELSHCSGQAVTYVSSSNARVLSPPPCSLACAAKPVNLFCMRCRYNALDVGEEPHLSALQKNCPAPAFLELRVNAQVMLLKNLETGSGLVNGTRGIVTGFVRPSDDDTFSSVPVVTFERPGGAGGFISNVAVYPQAWKTELGTVLAASRTQIPLKLAYAMSIHKSQGMTISLLEVSMARIFEFGQAYVALSRAVSLERLRIVGFKPQSIRAHPRVSEFYKTLECASKYVAPPPVAMAVRAPTSAVANSHAPAWSSNSDSIAGPAAYACASPGGKHVAGAASCASARRAFVSSLLSNASNARNDATM